MKTFLLALALTFPALATDYYVSASVTGGGSGTRVSPQSFSGRCSDAFTAGDRILLLAGTYYGRYTCTGSNVIMESDPLTCPDVLTAAPGSCATIDGNLTFTLAADLANASGTSTVSVSLGNGPGMPSSFVGYVDDEQLNCINKTGAGPAFSYTCNRGWTATPTASHTNGTVIYANGFILGLQGSDQTVRNIEIKSSYVGRGSTSEPLEKIKAILGIGVDIRAPRSFVYRMLVHDVGDAIDAWTAAPDSTIQDCVMYNNGWISLDRSHGKCTYDENITGFRHIYDIVCVNTFHSAVQAYGVTGSFNGGTIAGLLAANSGAPTVAAGAYSKEFNLLVGTNSVAIPDVTLDHIWTYNGSTGINLGFGGIANGNATLTNSYVPDNVVVDDWAGLTGSGNTVFGTLWPIFMVIHGPAAGTYMWDNNAYYDQTVARNCTPAPNRRAPFSFNAVTGPCGTLEFADWKADSLYDATSTYAATLPPNAVLIRQSALQAGRCVVAIYNWSHAATVAVDLSQCGSSAGQGYKIVNAFNPIGAAVATGTYNAGAPNVTVTMSDAAVTAVAVPPGATPAPTTAPEFLALIVVPTTSTYGFAGSLRGSAK